MGLFKVLRQAIGSVFCMKKKKDRKLKFCKAELSFEIETEDEKPKVKWIPSLATICEEQEDVYAAYDKIFLSLLAFNESFKKYQEEIEDGEEENDSF